jgi:hypothetical protein
MLDFEAMKEELFIARGKYATVNAAHREAWKTLQNQAQAVSDFTRGALSNDESYRNDAIINLQKISAKMFELSQEIESLRLQKESLFEAAWGDPNASDPFEAPDPI